MGRTLNVELSDETVERLDRLGSLTQQSRSSLAVAALESYTDEQLAIVEGITRGLEDMQERRVVPHDEAMRRLRQTVQSSRKA